MNTQLQRMMIVLFLVLTLIAVTVLFWLPVDNNSDRILAARETESVALFDLEAQDDKESELPEILFVEPLDDSDALADASPLQKQVPQGLDNTGFAYTEKQAETSADTPKNLEQDSQSGNMDDANIATSSAPLKMKEPTDAYAYDVMGNKRAHVSDYTIRKNDWFSTITGKHWDDLFMWPDLYTMNTRNLRSADPDLIYPGEKVSVYESLTVDGEFSDEDRKTLLSAYLKVYKIYKQVGESKDLAAAQLLASAVRYDKDFLQNYSSVIATKDRQMAERLIKEQKFLD